MPDLEDLFRQVDAAQPEILELEQALVRIPSVNTGVMPTGNESPVCEFARDWLARDGIPAEILESAPGRGQHHRPHGGYFGKGRTDVHVPHRRGAG